MVNSLIEEVDVLINIILKCFNNLISFLFFCSEPVKEYALTHPGLLYGAM